MARILVVDDEESERVLLRIALTGAGHDVYLAADGEEALAYCREMPMDAVITDLQMPNMHGLELISLLRDVSPRPGIVAISGTGEPQLDVADAVGADATLAKPLDQGQLLAAVGRVLEAVAYQPTRSQ
jgi:CheY-like chemotaxis protein